MATIDRTAYPGFFNDYSDRELVALFSPSEEELGFAKSNTREEHTRFLLLIYLKSHQYLGYFPTLNEVPSVVLAHISNTTGLPSESPAGTYSERSKNRTRNVVRKYLQVTPFTEGGRKLLEELLPGLSRIMSDPADLINASIDELIKNRYSLPGFELLKRITRQVRHHIHMEIFQTVDERLPDKEKQALDTLLSVAEGESLSPFTRIKEPPGVANLTHLKAWKEKYDWLSGLADTNKALEGIPFTKIRQFATEAHAQEMGDIMDILTPAKRSTLLVSLIHFTKMQTKDELVDMLIKRVRKTEKKGKDRLEEMRVSCRKSEEELLSIFGKVIDIALTVNDDGSLGSSIKALIQANGGADYLAAKTGMVTESHQNNYLPFLWKIHAPYRKVLTEIVDILGISPTGQDNGLTLSWKIFAKYRSSHRKYITGEDFPLAFASQTWMSKLRKEKDGEVSYDRQLLELCLLHYLSDGLQTTDLFVRDSLKYADYREQLLPWEECRSHLKQYCEKWNFYQMPMILSII